jgi:hypothetical protein
MKTSLRHAATPPAAIAPSCKRIRDRAAAAQHVRHGVSVCHRLARQGHDRRFRRPAHLGADALIPAKDGARPPHREIGSTEQMSGAKKQVPHGAKR